MRLESLVSRPEALPDGFTLSGGVLHFTGLLAALADCDDAVKGANWLHGTLLEALATWAGDAAARTGVEIGLRPLAAEGLPPNDGSISLGQAWVARREWAARKPQLEVLS